MKGFIKFVLKNKLAVWLLTIILAAAGIYSGLKMKMETIPDISVPIVTLSTTYVGASPEQVEEKVSSPFEKAVQNLKGVKSVYSNSYQNASSLQIEFDYGTDMKSAQEDVKEAIEKITLPETAQKPVIDRVNINAFPIVAMSVADKEQSIAELTKTVEDYFVPKLEGVDGVSSVSVSGQQVNKVQLQYDQKKLAENGLTEDTVKQYIQAMDTRIPLGMFQFAESEQAVVVNGKMTTMNKLEDLKIPIQSATPSATPSATDPAAATATAKEPFVKLGDIATLKLKGEVESVSRTNGQDAIAVQVIKAQDANTVDVVDDVKEMSETFKKDNKGLAIDVTLDQGQPIKDSVSTMIDKALFGAIFAVIIIMLFLRNFKSTIIAIISIPMSLLIAVIGLKYMDISLNMMTLGAMTVAIGRVIDDSIVVVENIFRRIHLEDEKLRGRELIREATLEMFRPILSSTIVTVAVFLPIGLVGGMVGELFLPFGLTMAFALIASLVIAITIVPALAHTLFKKQIYGAKTVKKEEHGKMAHSYKKILTWVLDHKIITFSGSIIVLVASLFLAPLVGFSFLPDDEQKMAYLTYTPEPGQTRDQVIKDVEKVENMVSEVKDVDTVQVSIGGNNPMNPGASNGALMYLIYDPDTKDFAKKNEKLVQKIMAVDQRGEWKQQDFSGGMSSNELTYSVYGNSIDDIRPVVAKIETVLNDSKELKDVKSSLSEEYDQKTLEVNREKAQQYGLSTAQIAMMINPNVPATVLTTVMNDGKEINVEVHSDVKSPDTFDKVLEQKIKTPVGKEIKLQEVVTVKEGKTLATVSRSASKYYATVSATITTKDVTEASSAVQNKIDKIKLPNNVDVNSGGVTDDIKDSFTKLGLAMLAAIAIVYFTLVVTFGEGLAPFSILFSLPFTVIGALVGLWIAGETISVSSMIGLLMLIGIVVTNAIVLVDRIIHREHDGLSMREAILDAGATRLRPILMTAIATIGALIPLAIGAEGSGLISKGLGITVIGGLISSTALTLIIVPLVYEFLSKLLKKDRAHEDKEN
ncbi:efflux RND transporter permease subunit [Kurthia sibirica]|uniref:Swarming motility protein SwrC n=1 Tax=Kurthia sibirica TaxID=202750 RepID=A0A2U3AQJ6_9BACL|nr:efflux RND transporter permease subunit [Kurthia sibirica]PWI26776.1 Swarming motility protein SwrC [Kurthia sibirica]GEK32691.1 swarming motility protein SwrC [Kurthia sibirica]